MRLDDYIESLEPDEDARRRQLAKEKSYAVTDYLEDFESQFEETVQGDSLFGATAPSIFVGRTNYPRVSTGLLSPVADGDPESFVTDGNWYQQGLGVGDVVQRRSGLLNSTRRANVDVHDVWDGFVGVQREVAIARDPVDLEIGLDGKPELDLDVDGGVATPRGPRAKATSVDLTENPYVPKPVKKTLEDDDWQAQGAMTYLYRRGLDVYDVNRVLSAGALGQGENRRLVPTRWSITAVDDTIGQYLRGQIRHAPSIDQTEVWANEFMGNRYWVVMTPGNWEFELVEMKAPGSIWNPDQTGEVWMGSASEGYEGRSGYVDETAGAYYASRLGVLEHLADRGRQAKCLVLREVSDDYWAPVGVWQVRESVRNAFDGDRGTAETFHEAVRTVTDRLPVSLGRLRRKSTMVSGIQASLTDF
ncbi:DNA repair protein NreA [Haloarchaeobius sp. TZWWS8]|uniref:DNA repair protein NreA n=1 Tax=Haloarchaeobius sp. TZWWS8 TaxID=3446121 RepID=UPI003EB86514